MWCDRCRADAAAEVSAETGRANCATCGAELGSVRRPSTDQARELLKRWSSGLELDGASSPAARESSGEGIRGEGGTAVLVNSEVASEPVSTLPLTPPPPSTTRIEGPERFSQSEKAPNYENEKGSPEMSASRKPNRGPSAQWPAPTVQMRPSWSQRQTRKRSTIGQIFGQILAYLGILAITGGTALVIWGYFGGPAEYAPTGWLVATGGQMLLFLGIVTLVSEGLEQSSVEMHSHVELLDHRLERLERNAAKSGLEARLKHESHSGDSDRDEQAA